MAMSGSRAVASKAWDLGSLGPWVMRSYTSPQYRAMQSQNKFALQLQLRCMSASRAKASSRARGQLSQLATQRHQAQRSIQTSQKPPQKAQTLEKSYRQEMKESVTQTDKDNGDEGAKRYEKAAQDSQVNLRAKLSKANDENAPKGGWKEIVRLLMIAKPELKTLSGAFVCLLISSAVSMSLPFSIGKIMDATSSESDKLFGLDPTHFYTILGGALAAGACANYGRIIILRVVSERIVARMRTKLFRKTFVQNAEFFDANKTGDLISRLGNDTVLVGKSTTQNLSDGLRSFVTAGVGFTLMGLLSLKLTGVLAICFPPVAISAFFFGRAVRLISRKIQANLGTLTKIGEERIANVRTSQAFAGEIQEVNRYNHQVRKIFDLGKRDAYIAASFFSTSGFMGNMTVLIVLWVGSGMVKDGAISIGELTSFLMYTAYAGSATFGLTGFYSELMKGVGAATRLFELEDRVADISATKGAKVTSAAGAIEFKNVSFAYPLRPQRPIFTDVSFTIPAGTNVAIVAPSGAGKSTVAALLLRFYDTTRGTITIAGKDISGMNAKQLRRKIGYVGQEPVLFSGSIAENIAYGKPLATRKEIMAAAKQANCQFIDEFPEGLETNCGARGTQLSGGQKQRIAIARALIKSPDILILDEATSALDAESETLVNQALHKLLEGKNTTISIAHRLSTIQRSDIIICLGADGKVHQVGTYAELSADKEGSFAKLMEWQISGGPMPPRRTEPSPELSEEEEMQLRLEESSGDGLYETDATGEEVGEGAKVRGEEQTAAEAAIEKPKGGV